jgi:hypothetical protein
MKTKNQTELPLLELALSKAANEEGFPVLDAHGEGAVHKQAWNPREVWRTRVKSGSKFTVSDPTPI